MVMDMGKSQFFSGQMDPLFSVKIKAGPKPQHNADNNDKTPMILAREKNKNSPGL